MKKHLLFLLLIPTLAFSAMESTPFKIPQDQLYITADVINFAYNCVLMEDNSNIYEVISNSYSKKGWMHVTIRCQQYESNITLPLFVENNFVQTPLAVYPVEFSTNAPASCKAFTSLQVIKNSELLDGYVLKLT